jgi:hypothetical protein
MPEEIRVSIIVDTPDDTIKLSRAAEAAPRIHTHEQAPALNAGDDATAATRMLGEMADEVLRHFGFSDAFAQYVGIASVLNDNDNGADGVHVRGVRELSAMVGRLAAERDAVSADLAWAVNPANWMVDLVHDRVGAVNQVDSSAPPRSDTYTDTTGRHDGATALPAMVLTQVADRLTSRIDDIIAAARSESELGQVMKVRSIIQSTVQAEIEQAAYRTRVRLRPEPGKAFMSTPESPALHEVRLTHLTPDAAAEALDRLKRRGFTAPSLPQVEARLVETARAGMAGRRTFADGAPEPGDVWAVRRMRDLVPTEFREEPLDVLFKRLSSTGEWEASGAHGNGQRYPWHVLAEAELIDCTDEFRYSVREKASDSSAVVLDRSTGETFPVSSVHEGHTVVAALHEAAAPPMLAESRAGR